MISVWILFLILTFCTEKTNKQKNEKNKEKKHTQQNKVRSKWGMLGVQRGKKRKEKTTYEANQACLVSISIFFFFFFYFINVTPVICHKWSPVVYLHAISRIFRVSSICHVCSLLRRSGRSRSSLSQRAAMMRALAARPHRRRHGVQLRLSSGTGSRFSM